MAICILNKDKPPERRGKVLFVDAEPARLLPRRQGAERARTRSTPRKIVEAFRAYEEVERFAHVADLEEIAANDFNLNISRYVDTTEPIEVPSVEEALAQLREAEQRRDEAAARMDELLAELGYAPKG